MGLAEKIYPNQYPNEVGPHNPELQLRFLRNPISNWVGRFITDHTRHPNAEFHLDIFDELAWGDQFMAMIVPRSYAKSTITSENFVTYLACEYPRLKKMYDETGKSPVYPFRKVMAVSGTGPKGEEIMYHVRQELETNENILAEYGNIQGDTWTNRLIRTKDGFEFKVGGRGCQVRGFRPELFIGDDIEDDEEVDSDEQMEKTRKWLDSAVINTLDEIECRGFFIGTDLHPDGALRYLSNKPKFVTKEYWAYIDRIEEAGYELWPSKWPHDRLQERKAMIGARAFRQEFLNDPMISENPIIMREWFQQYEPESAMFQNLLQQSLYTVQCCDPAISKSDKADFTALVTVSATFEKDPRIFVRVGGVVQDHWDLGRTVTEIFRLHTKFGCNEVGIETVAYQQALADEFERYLETHRRNLPVRKLVPDRDKERRTNAEAPAIERGRVYVDLRDPLTKKLVDQCVNFQPGKTNIKKDLMDAFVYCLYLIREWGGRHQQSSGLGVTPYGS